MSGWLCVKVKRYERAIVAVGKRKVADSFILDMVLLPDLPPEGLTLILGNLHDENVSLTSVSLTGNRALTAIAQNLMLRDLRICLKLPIDGGHRFYPTFRRICNSAPRNAVRSVTFKCRSESGLTNPRRS
ncbi:hypothetical protein BDZ89DRAFT_1130337 [Hymenopellis radicata]|nr:hypothetical protein BDZ89DRAFT_1130337 [Hymenopellis radicata]